MHGSHTVRPQVTGVYTMRTACHARSAVRQPLLEPSSPFQEPPSEAKAHGRSGSRTKAERPVRLPLRTSCSTGTVYCRPAAATRAAALTMMCAHNQHRLGSTAGQIDCARVAGNLLEGQPGWQLMQQHQHQVRLLMAGSFSPLTISFSSLPSCPLPHSLQVPAHRRRALSA